MRVPMEPARCLDVLYEQLVPDGPAQSRCGGRTVRALCTKATCRTRSARRALFSQFFLFFPRYDISCLVQLIPSS